MNLTAYNDDIVGFWEGRRSHAENTLSQGEKRELVWLKLKYFVCKITTSSRLANYYVLGITVLITVSNVTVAWYYVSTLG